MLEVSLAQTVTEEATPGCDQHYQSSSCAGSDSQGSTTAGSSNSSARGANTANGATCARLEQHSDEGPLANSSLSGNSSISFTFGTTKPGAVLPNCSNPVHDDDSLVVDEPPRAPDVAAASDELMAAACALPASAMMADSGSAARASPERSPSLATLDNSPEFHFEDNSPEFTFGTTVPLQMPTLPPLADEQLRHAADPSACDTEAESPMLRRQQQQMEQQYARLQNQALRRQGQPYSPHPYSPVDHPASPKFEPQQQHLQHPLELFSQQQQLMQPQLQLETLLAQQHQEQLQQLQLHQQQQQLQLQLQQQHPHLQQAYLHQYHAHDESHYMVQDYETIVASENPTAYGQFFMPDEEYGQTAHWVHEEEEEGGEGKMVVLSCTPQRLQRMLAGSCMAVLFVSLLGTAFIFFFRENIY